MMVQQTHALPDARPETLPLPSQRTPRSSRRPHLTLPAGWPLFALFGGYPLWWVLGFAELSCLIFAVPMAVHLVRQRHIEAPRWLGVWLLFVVWVLGGILVLQVHAPGTIAGASSTRYLTFVYRFLWYVGATVVLLYIVNTRKELSNHRIALALSNMFVVVTAGGVLGVLVPHLEFRSALEYVLPGAIANNGFLHGLIHPVTAQVQSFLGYAEARPSAPFAFTNEWGLAIACFLPFFVLTWCRRDAGWRRLAAPVVLLMATFGIVFSLNRGLWLALAAVGVFVAVRFALMGRVKLLGLLVGGAFVAFTVVALSPLGDLVLQRFAHPDSNQGRTNLGTLTFLSVLHGSPIMGFGTTRNVLGNFSSIASAASATCPGCSPPPLGTQGHLWLVLFCQGLVGLTLYLTFFIIQLVRHVRLSSPYVIAALSVLIVHFVTLPVYDSIGPSLFAIMIAVGMLVRGAAERDEAGADEASHERARGTPGGRQFRAYVESARRHLLALVVLALLGGLAGGLVHLTQGTSSTAVQSILVPTNPSSARRVPEITLDTDAQLVTSDAVLAALMTVEGSGATKAELASQLGVSALPNTRILHVSFTAPTSGLAVRGIEAMTPVYLDLLRRVTRNPHLITNRSEIVQETTIEHSLDGWVVSSVSGAMLALVLGLAYALVIADPRARIRRPTRAISVDGLPIVARVRAGSAADTDGGQLGAAREVLGRLSISSVHAIVSSDAALTAARVLDDSIAPSLVKTAHRAVIVMSVRTRRRELTALRRSMEACGQRVIAVVLVEKR